MNRWKRIASSSVLLAALPLFSQRAKTSSAGDSAQPRKSAAADTVPPDAGERVFEQNCSRCHNAPQGFSPQISGTIVHHMRVRASLSQKDAQALLRFLNP
jgi:mono/diheme cytochrome c family protein